MTPDPTTDMESEAFGRETKSEKLFVDDLAQEIRRLDGDSDNRLGAGALAEALLPFLARRAPIPQGEADLAERLMIGYTNWRGEFAVRTIVPVRLWFGSTEWHPEPQWLLKAIDVEKDAERDFALTGFCPAPSHQGAAEFRERAATVAYVEAVKHCSARDGMTLIGHPVGQAIADAIRALPEGTAVGEGWRPIETAMKIAQSVHETYASIRDTALHEIGRSHGQGGVDATAAVKRKLAELLPAEANNADLADAAAPSVPEEK